VAGNETGGKLPFAEGQMPAAMSAAQAHCGKFGKKAQIIKMTPGAQGGGEIGLIAAKRPSRLGRPFRPSCPRIGTRDDLFSRVIRLGCTSLVRLPRSATGAKPRSLRCSTTRAAPRGLRLTRTL
jgi:hypothetical protein